MVTGRQIKNGTVTSIDVKDRSLTGKDLSAASTASFTTIQGYQRIRRSTDVPAGGAGSVSATCPSTKRVIGGGSFFGSSLGTQFAISTDGTTGAGYGVNTSGSQDELTVDVVCAFVGAVTPAARAQATAPRSGKD